MKKQENNDYNINWGGLSITILIVSGLLIIFSFFAPIIFVKENKIGLDFTDTGAIGDTIGGLMNPFIAISGVLLTFLAFYIQFKANRLQRALFRQELDSNKFENQFYEMLRLHKENVNDVVITLKSSYFTGQETIKNESQIRGREVFKHLVEELNIIYYVTKYFYHEDEGGSNSWIRKAYEIFFNGLKMDESIPINHPERKKHDSYVLKLAEIADARIKGATQFKNAIKDFEHSIETIERLRYDIFRGHSSSLAHYYRHLYQTVKFIVTQNESFIDYSEKRNYLRILRAQLSNQEQAMLFYNWKSDFGSNWENETNHFFTDYRMIHNLYNDLLIEDFDLNEIFKTGEKPYYRMESGRNKDPLFEFEDWK